MKGFIEEYGLIIVGVVILLIIILAATPIGQGIVASIRGFISNLATSGGLTAPTTVTGT